PARGRDAAQCHDGRSGCPTWTGDSAFGRERPMAVRLPPTAGGLAGGRRSAREDLLLPNVVPCPRPTPGSAAVGRPELRAFRGVVGCPRGPRGIWVGD